MGVSASTKTGIAKGLMMIGACVLILSSGLDANAQGRRSKAELADRLARVESAIQDLQGLVYAVEDGTYGRPQVTYNGATIPNDYATPSAGGDLSVRISQVERELQSLTGRLEELAYRIDQNSTRLETLTQAIAANNTLSTSRTGAYTSDPYTTGPGAVETGRENDQGIVDGTNYGAQPYQDGVTPYGASGSANGAPVALGSSGPVDELQPVQEPTPGSGVTLTGDVNVDYDNAFNALLNGDYQLAEKSFAAFLEAYPNDPRSPDAQFRLGEIYLATGANANAARAFLNHVKTWPRDARASESYLKLGTAYSRLGKTAEACKIFKVLDGKFPNASSDVKQRLAIERGNAGC